MVITDPIADMLTRIRNATSARHSTVDVPTSGMKRAIAQILLDEGYIKAFELVDDGAQGMIHITLKSNKEKAICGLPRVLKGLGIAIVSTSKGIMTDKKARELNVGGEVLAFVW